MEDINAQKGKPNVKINNDSLAYVIFTSGSTGRPKGVMISHRSLVNYVCFAAKNYVKNEEVTFPLYTSISFDLTITSIFTPLITGNKIVIYDEDQKSLLIEKVISENKSDIIKLTPAHLKILKDSEVLRLPSRIKRFIVGGEDLETQLAKDIYEKFAGKIEIYNEYGPTEATVGCMIHKFEPEEKSLSVPIGIPASNAQIYVLDKYLRPVPIGVNGEIYISGDGLAKGYLSMEELTLQRFIDNPFVKGQKMYKTGDLACRLSDGNVIFKGRTDDQVKIRGYRIELEEIESRLIKYEKVTTAIVLAKQKDGNKYLVAYYVSDEELEIAKLRDYLSELLPEYMIPSYYIHLKKFPLTSNGKTDKKALPDPEIKAGNDYIAPSNDIERELVEIWSKVLKLEKEVISVNRSFFELGGHSILAMNLISQVHKTFGAHLGLPDFFINPSVKGLSKLIENDNEGGITLPDIVIDKENRNKSFPLTDVQQAYWIGQKDLFEYGNIGTHGYMELFTPVLDIVRFNKVLQSLIQRHEMFRMIVTEDGEQCILEEVSLFEVQVLDLRTKSESEEEKLFYQLRKELSHQIFSSSQWPLFDIRVTIFRDNTYKVHFSMDALIMDAGSLMILFQEFGYLYLNENASLPRIEISFRDYVLTEIGLRKTKLYEKSKQYWLDRLVDFPLGPELPIESTQNNTDKPHFERHNLFMPKGKWSILQNSAKILGITPTVLLIGCFAEVLNCWCKSSRFILNLTLFNRIPFHKDVDKLIGDFTSLTLLEIDFREEKEFSKKLKDIQQRMWEDLDNKYFSGVEVQRELSRVKGSSVIMPVVVTSTLGMKNDEDKEALTENEVVNNPDEKKNSYSITQTPQVWIDFQIGDNGKGLVLNWDSIEGLFPKGMLDEMFTSFQNLLDSLINEDRLWKSKTLVFLPESQHKVRIETNSTSCPIPNKLLHELFRDQATKRPDAIAIETRRNKLTYGELNRLSNIIGFEVKSKGAQPNQLVGIVMEKCWEQIAGCLGVLVSGAAYLPIDAELPPDRIMLLLEQGEVNIVLTTPSIAKRIQFSQEKKIILIEEHLLNNKEDVQLESVQKPDDLAYVIFTSGSTGIPKGVMIDHKGAVNTILDINDRFNISENDKVFAISSLSFDLSVYDIFGLLGAGGTMVIPDQADLKDPEAWFFYVNNYSVTVWNTVPALMQMLIEYTEEQNNGLESLRVVLMSGDWIPVQLPSRIRNQNNKVEIISLGGATEASIWSIYYKIENVNPEWKSIPYGKPLKNQCFYVLKPNMNQCPDYVPGDLYIGGDSLTKGYWRDEKKTNQSVIVNPNNGEKLYKTGDLGRYLPDGNIEFLGREDFQVKIQGYRIELGEIEAAVKQNENIKDAIVIAAGGAGEAKNLVAYIVPNKEFNLVVSKNETTGDNVGELAHAENTITDKKERRIFKLEEHGIRNITKPLLNVKLLKQDAKGRLIIRKDKGNRSRFINEKMNLGEFSGVFDCLMQRKFEGQLLPKYYYPSAGSLYPVQTYISVKPEMIEGVKGGHYYYNPREHCLELLNSTESHEATNDESDQCAFTMHLISDLNAILPMYGNLSEIFSYQEAGYLSNLLLNTCRENIALEPSTILNKDELSKHFSLSPEHLHLQSFSCGKAIIEKSREEIDLFELPPKEGEVTLKLGQIENEENENVQITYLGRKSYRTFNKEQITQRELNVLLNSIIIKRNSNIFYQKILNVYLQAKENSIEGLGKGVYYFDPYEKHLKLIDNEHDVDPIFNGNGTIYNSAGFSIFLTGKKAGVEEKEKRNSALFLSGYIGQNIMNISVNYRIGLCAIGTVNQKCSKEILKFSENEEVLHSFLGGKVNAEQIESIEQYIDADKTHSPVEILRNYLKEKLPYYMIPSYVVLLDSIPLNSNGKINRKALPDPEIKAEDNYVAPSTEIEEKLVEIWSEVLKIDQELISVNRSFFELGGHSLKATVLVNKINKELNITIPLKEIFAKPTINQQAEFIETNEWLSNKDHEFDQVEKFQVTL